MGKAVLKNSSLAQVILELDHSVFFLKDKTELLDALSYSQFRIVPLNALTEKNVPK